MLAAYVACRVDALPDAANFLDLDPRPRDRGGLGRPLIRTPYAMWANEHCLTAFMEGQAAVILHTMRATKTWRGPRFAGVVSSHDLGGYRMGEDPAESVVAPDLGGPDTPRLYVFGTAVFFTCHGGNPTLTMGGARLPRRRGAGRTTPPGHGTVTGSLAAF